MAGSREKHFEPAIYQDEKEFIHQFEIIILHHTRKRAPAFQQEPFAYSVVFPGITSLNCPF